MMVANEKLYPQRLTRFNKNPFCVSIPTAPFFIALSKYIPCSTADYLDHIINKRHCPYSPFARTLQTAYVSLFTTTRYCILSTVPVLKTSISYNNLKRFFFGALRNKLY